MSLSKPRIVFAALVIASASLGGCGYTPLYGHSGGDTQMVDQLSGIEVARIPDRLGQMMRTEIRRGLSPKGPKGVPDYRLHVTLGESVAQLALAQNAFATRANLSLLSEYRLVRTADNMEVASGTANSVASYNILSSDFATQSAQADARERAVVGLAQTIRQRLAVYFYGSGSQTKAPLP